MALGKIKADQLEHSTAGSVDTQFVVSGISKGYCHFDQTAPSITTSLNASSLTDSGTGYGKVNWTNSMSNANYSTTTGNRSYNAIGSSEYVTGLLDDKNNVARTSGSWSFMSVYAGTSAAAEFDSNTAICSAIGDLA